MSSPVETNGTGGGVAAGGWTTISSSLAVALASSAEVEDRKVLIVSTDPAHSLGDALDVDLRGSGGGGGEGEGGEVGDRPRPVVLDDPLTNRRLHALEVDPSAALERFRANLRAFDVSSLSSSLGVDVPPKFLEELGLDDLREVIRNPPPGLDELVALSNVLDPAFAREYDVIVVDTAPTGHTLRMLRLPQFLDGFLKALLTLRGKLKGLIGALKMFLPQRDGAEAGAANEMDVDDALEALESFQRQAARLRERLRDPDRTKFVVVSIPTVLSVRESARLLGELDEQGIRASDVVVNQRVGSAGDGGVAGSEDGAPEAMRRYYRRRAAGQRRWIDELTEACAEVSASEEYRGNAPGGDDGRGIVVTEVPYYDVELVGVPALGYLGQRTFGTNSDFERLVGPDDRDEGTRASRREPKVIVCGGKGGVGKTTTSGSLAVAMAAAGHDVALVSTDPAHSLGDALDVDLRGGSPVDVPTFGVPSAGAEGSLMAMEIDPASALAELRDSIDGLLGRTARSDGGGGGNSELSSAMSSLGEIIDTLPAGADEVVALAKVIQLVRRGKYDRVVLDTAPTGHTLRMLAAPSFLADLIERSLSVARKVNSNPAVRMLLAGAARDSEYDLDDAGEAAKNALLKFQVAMYDLEDLFADPESTEFLVVTIGTELATRESARLVNDLTFGDPDMPIRVRNVVVNQVLEAVGDDGEMGREEEDEKLRGFATRLAKSQELSVAELRRNVEGIDPPPRVTEATMLDAEPRGVYGLKALSERLLAERTEVVA
ncbi:hypothetical protein ACHAWF_013993 [Thalassiosira exigua]